MFLSPLRYPGGKSQMYNYMVELLKNKKCDKFAEPFAGGAGLGLLLLKKQKIKKLYLNDSDYGIYSFWKTVLIDHQFLIDKILATVTELGNDLDKWLQEREKQKRLLLERGYLLSRKKTGWATFFLNRVNFSGIIQSGPIGGYKQTGKWKINCKWTTKGIQTLINNITDINQMKKDIEIKNCDYENFISILPKDTFLFLDPPYVTKQKFYNHNFRYRNHFRLQEYIKEKIKHNNWLLTYKDNELIWDLYKKDFKIELKQFRYSVKQAEKQQELCISSKT